MTIIFTAHFALAAAGCMQPFVFRADDAARLRAPLVLETMKTENPLPEDRKRMVEKWYDVISKPGYECIITDELPTESEHRCKLTPLETVPLLTVSAENGITQNDVNKAARMRTLPEIPARDIQESFVRGSGAGGQKINKTNNKVVLLHIPTRLRVDCQTTRSLQQNRKIAYQKLRQKLCLKFF